MRNKINISKYPFFLLLFGFFFNRSAGQTHNLYFIKKAIENLDTVKFITYKVIYNHRDLFKTKDTLTDTVLINCLLISREKEQLYFKIQNLHSNTVYYLNHDGYYSIDKVNKQYFYADNGFVEEKDYKGFPWSPTLKLSFIFSRYSNIFLDSDIQDSLRVDSGVDIYGQNCFEITMHLKNELEAKNIYAYDYITKNEYQFIRSIFRIQFQDQIQYNDYYIQTFSYKPFDTSIFYFDSCKYINFKHIGQNNTPQNSQSKKKFIVDSTVSDRRLVSLKKDTVSVAQFRGKYVILDFWYMACYPCLKTLPVLQRLQNEHLDNLIVLGINVNKNDNPSLDTFLHKRNITYIQLLNGAILAQEYGLTAFPTLVLLDKTGKIKLIENGYSDTLEDKIKKIITR